MAKIDQNFAHDMYKFIHRPIREADRLDGGLFVERFLIGPQTIFEDNQRRIDTIKTLNNPATIRADLLQHLKAHVGFTDELNNITNDLSDNDLRKLISLAVAIWKQKGLEVGYKNIVRLFTGKSSRVFNWFDFRLIVGEKAFGEEQLGEDAWLISVPSVEASGVFGEDEPNEITNLLTLEGSHTLEIKDRSLTRNHGDRHGTVYFYTTPATGFPSGSEKYLALRGGNITQPDNPAYDFSADFSVEMFFRTSVSAGARTLWSKTDSSGKGVRLEINSAAGTITCYLDDGTTTANFTASLGAGLDDNVLRHIALVVDRTNGAKLWLDGTNVSPTQAMGAFGDLTNTGRIVLGGDEVGVNVWEGDIDNFRMAKNVVYAIASASITPPLSGFIEFIEEALDEFQTDIRIVDDKTGLNKVLIQRILNLMRPVSERLNVIFISFYDDFFDGIGNFDLPTGSATVNTSQQMELAPSTIANTSVFQDTEFQDIVLQVKANNKDDAGQVFSTLFFLQDTDNYYEFRVDFANKRVGLFKLVAGVETQIGPWVNEDIVSKASYILTVSTFLNPSTNETTIKTFVDSNLQHEVVDSSFVKGKFGAKTDANTTMQIDEIEMIEHPVDIRRIDPSFDL